MDFDYLNGKISGVFLAREANEVLWRARSLLRRKTSVDIKAIVDDASYVIDAFFQVECDVTLKAIRDDGREDLLNQNGSSFGQFSEEAYERYNIRDPENTSDLEALKEGVDYIVPSIWKDEKIRISEVFAAFAISRIEEFARRTELVKRSEMDVAYAARALFEAVDAVAYSEAKRSEEGLVEQYRHMQSQTEARLDQKLRDHLEASRAIIEADYAASQKEEKRKKAKDMAASRHAEGNAVKNRIIAMYRAEKSNFPSAEKAAKHYCEMLEAENIIREQRTVVTWLRESNKRQAKLA